MKKILVIGSLNMDFSFGVAHAPTAGETVIAQSLQCSCGGKGANQAYAAARLGGDVAMLGAVGHDTYGDRLIENLGVAGVDTKHILRSESIPTGMAMIVVEDTGENRIVVSAGANGGVDRGYIDQHSELIAQADLVLLQMEIPQDTVIYAARLAKALGKLVILDPAPAVSGLPDELFACVDVLKPNETEAAILLGKDKISPEEAIAALQKRGTKHILITLGAEGAVLGQAGCAPERIAALPVKAVDTTAAGDSFTAALAVALAQGESFQAATRFAMHVAAIVVTRPGAQASIPTLTQVEASFPKE